MTPQVRAPTAHTPSAKVSITCIVQGPWRRQGGTKKERVSESNTEKRQSHRDEGRWRWEYREMENGGRTNEQTGGRTELDEGQEGKKP